MSIPRVRKLAQRAVTKGGFQLIPSLRTANHVLAFWCCGVVGMYMGQSVMHSILKPNEALPTVSSSSS